MHPIDPALVEVSLLYRDTPELKSHLEAICETVEDHGSVVLEVIELGDASLAVVCDDLRVVMTDDAGPVPLDPLLGVAVSVLQAEGEVEVLPSLEAMSHSLRIVVIDPERAPICGPASVDVKRAIAWDLAQGLAGETGASLIHWAATNVLYTKEDMYRIAAQDRAWTAASDVAAAAAQRPEDADREDWVDVEPSPRRPVVLGDGPLPEAHPPSRLSAALEAARSVAGPARTLLPLDRIRDSLNLRRTLH